MDSSVKTLQASILTMQCNVKQIKELLLIPMKDQQSELVLKKKSVPLCQTTRVFRLEALVSVAERTIEALDNFLFDEVMVKSTSEALLRTLADKIEKKVSNLNHHCKHNLPSVGILFCTTAQIETHISIIHTSVEAILKILKKATNILEKEGLLPGCPKVSTIEKKSTTENTHSHQSSISSHISNHSDTQQEEQSSFNNASTPSSPQFETERITWESVISKPLSSASNASTPLINKVEKPDSQKMRLKWTDMKLKNTSNASTTVSKTNFENFKEKRVTWNEVVQQQSNASTSCNTKREESLIQQNAVLQQEITLSSSSSTNPKSDDLQRQKSAASNSKSQNQTLTHQSSDQPSTTTSSDLLITNSGKQVSKRRLSFADFSNEAIELKGKQGQSVVKHRTLVIDILLMKLPLKYSAK